MPKLKFPVQSGKSPVWPSDGACPICSKKLDSTFAYFNGGALLKDSPASKSASISPLLSGFLTLGWHPNHEDPHPANHDVHEGVDIAENVSHGQFEFMFCSTVCLRNFLNGCVDSLEQRIVRARRKKSRQDKK